MKSYQENRTLKYAIAVSVLLHATLLAVRFVAPQAFRIEPTDPGMEVILVNAKHANAPLKAEALAQANLDGGGNADLGRSKSPLPDMHKMDNGEALKAMLKRAAVLEQEQKARITRLRKSELAAPPPTDNAKPNPTLGGADLADTMRAIARQTAEITQSIDDQNKRPKKTHISPSTREVGYASYYKEMQKRIEEIGTLNFPQNQGRKMYGELVVDIPIFQDGSIYMKEGGVQIRISSGNPALDNAALSIVRRSAPFGRFPAKMRSADRDDLWVITTRFRFTREQILETDIRGGSN